LYWLFLFITFASFHVVPVRLSAADLETATIPTSDVPETADFSVPFGPRPGDASLIGRGQDHNCLPRLEYSASSDDCGSGSISDEWYVFTEFNRDRVYTGAPYGAGAYHPGEDWNSRLASGSPPGWGDLGEPVFSVGEGRVIAAGWTENYGNMVLIVHRTPSGSAPRFFLSVYAHLDTIAVAGCDTCDPSASILVGDPVDSLSQIGTVGKTHGGEGDLLPHLHFEIRRGSSFLSVVGTTIRLRDLDPSGIFSPNAWPKNEEKLVSSLANENGKNFIAAHYCDPSFFLQTTACRGRPGYEFALLDFTIDGNLLGGTVDGTYEFVDSFADGDPNVPPTAFLSCHPSPCIESGGALQLAEDDANGAVESIRFSTTFREDTALLLIPAGGGLFEPLFDTQGGSEIRALFRAVVPREGEFYAVGIVNGGAGIIESTALQVGNVGGLVGVSVSDANGTLLAADLVDVGSANGILLRLEVDDLNNLVRASYSVDAGQSFRSAEADWLLFNGHTTIFQEVGFAFPFAQGGRALE